MFSKGGLCRVKDDKLIIIDTTLNLSEKIDVLADALSQFDLEDIYMPPVVRKTVLRKSDKNADEDTNSIHDQEVSASKESA